jgi:hypothetical protein
MVKCVGLSSQYSPADLGRVCSDDKILDKPLGTAFALRQFLGLARQERVRDAQRANGGGIRQPARRVAAGATSEPTPVSDPNKPITFR